MHQLRYALLLSPRTPARVARGLAWLADACHRAITYAFALSALLTFTIYAAAGLIRWAA